MREFKISTTFIFTVSLNKVANYYLDVNKNLTRRVKTDINYIKRVEDSISTFLEKSLKCGLVK